jgi:DNA-directed RNA polymerase specialized sigma24 family protein
MTITYPPMDSEARFLYEKAGFAAYCAYRRLEREVDQNFEDAKQEAVLTFWETYQHKGDERYSFVAARNAVLQSLVRNKNPRALSLDYTSDDKDRPWTEHLAAGEPGQEETGDWLNDADLEELVTRLFTAPAAEAVVSGYRQLLRHQLAGHSLEETARVMGQTFEATRGVFRRLVSKLAGHYGVAPNWQAVSARLQQDADWEEALRAIAGKSPSEHTVAYNVCILRLLMRGYDVAAIATELGKGQSAIKDARKKLKAKLMEYCRHKGIEPPEYNRNGGGWRPAHHYGNHHGSPKRLN